MSRNNVRGPTSALTEFLKESGITPTTIARRRATQNQDQNQPIAGPSNVGGNHDNEEQGEDEDAPISTRRRTRASGAATGYVSDELDEPDEAETTPKKRKLTKAAEAKLKAQAKKKAKKDGDGEDESEEEDAYTALSKSLWTNSTSAKPPVGSFEECAQCEKQFTVTKYTIPAHPPPGYLCHSCAKASGNDPFKNKKPAAPRKRKAPADKRVVVSYEERRFPSLAGLCIQIITRHIDDVEALGDIGAINMDQISKAIARNRSLTAENAHLFYDVRNTSLTLYDVTKLPPPAYHTLACLNPSLTSLRLDFCGRMDDTVLLSFSITLPSLARLELLGPFLVRTEAWQKFFKEHKTELEGFLVTQSPRFDEGCVKALVENAKDTLKELRLKEIGKMNDGMAHDLSTLSGDTLKHLDLSDPSYSCSEDALISLMSALGPGLTHLDLSGHTLLTDRFLKEGLGKYARCLSGLVLEGLTELTDEGVAEFFDTWGGGGAPADVSPKGKTLRGKPKSKTKPKSAAASTPNSTAPANAPLAHLSLARNPSLSSASLLSLLAHSSASLTYLNINGWRGTSLEALNEIWKMGKELRKMDVGWCRDVDDFWVGGVLGVVGGEGGNRVEGEQGGCRKIEEIKCWGCNRLTEACPRKRGVNIYGVEAQKLL